MVQKKNYSRYFIILQEDEKGFAIASDKPPTGYVKLEVKNNKCKVSYYVQNLKKETTPYFMALVSGKKNGSRIIKVGELNIDDYGRNDVSYEYPIEDIAYVGLNVENVIGAAIVKLPDKNIVPVLSGFLTTDIPKWKEFLLLEGKTRAGEEVSEEKNIFDKYEENIEAAKREENIIVKEESPKESLSEELKATEEVIKDEEKARIDESIKGEEKARIDESIKDETEVIESNKEPELQDVDDYVNVRVEEEQEEPIDNPIDNIEVIVEPIDEKLIRDKDDLPKGRTGEFFKNLVKDYDEVKDISEIKRCKWYRIPIKDINNMCGLKNYNKYAVIYYPMMNYYPYIKKQGYFLLGYKCDRDGKLKCLVYAIPGKRDKCDQPYGGKSGFVTWVPSRGKEDEGYWLMFYDFRKSTILIPVK
ncbi:hypothetical protein JOC70_002117 [Clostridium pascui]|uniref:hypothetical protein n=1 Tax=Clostridium pascui TaxID=46609 RepID=UPI00195A342E|nr:hypothetical protein [Clostridium pascui]MBM7870632.1 hypothetical protein [Clostridium pascui]